MGLESTIPVEGLESTIPDEGLESLIIFTEKSSDNCSKLKGIIQPYFYSDFFLKHTRLKYVTGLPSVMSATDTLGQVGMNVACPMQIHIRAAD